jgi:hypothetical protein
LGQKVKVKVNLETEQAKAREDMQTHRNTVESLMSNKSVILDELVALEVEKSANLNKLGEQTRGISNDKLRDELNKLKTALRAAEYERIELKNKLENSLC